MQSDIVKGICRAEMKISVALDQFSGMNAPSEFVTFFKSFYFFFLWAFASSGSISE